MKRLLIKFKIYENSQKKRKESSITFSYIWNVDIPKCDSIKKGLMWKMSKKIGQKIKRPNLMFGQKLKKSNITFDLKQKCQIGTEMSQNNRPPLTPRSLWPTISVYFRHNLWYYLALIQFIIRLCHFSYDL